MRRALTDRDMLRAARRRLAEHLATRPTSTTEAAQIAAAHRAVEAGLIAQAERLEGLRMPTSAEIGRGPLAPTMQHQAAIRLALARSEAGRIRQQALHASMSAEAWERIQDDPASQWERTRREYQGRVDYYAALCGACGASEVA